MVCFGIKEGRAEPLEGITKGEICRTGSLPPERQSYESLICVQSGAALGKTLLV